jgi:chaperone modulatory protein CbpM
MISFAAVLARVPGLDAATLAVWIERDWVRPRRDQGGLLFQEIDVARLQLILDLHGALEVGDPAVPVVLSLLDQLHETRRQMRRLCAALEEAGEESVASVIRRLGGLPG